MSKKEKALVFVAITICIPPSVYLLLQSLKGDVLSGVFGLMLIGMLVTGVVEGIVAGVDKDHPEGKKGIFFKNIDPERAKARKWILSKGADMAYRFTYSSVFILMFLHTIYKPLDTTTILVILFVVMISSEAISTLFFYHKWKKGKNE